MESENGEPLSYIPLSAPWRQLQSHPSLYRETTTFCDQLVSMLKPLDLSCDRLSAAQDENHLPSATGLLCHL